MSEAVSNAEIEDVLSSIRRLVSENAGAIRRERDPEPTEEKLVLTPAFRVKPPETNGVGAPDPAAEAAIDISAETESRTEAAVAQVVEAAEAEPATDAPDIQHVTEGGDEDAVLSPLEERIAELEAAVSQSTADFEPDGSEAGADEHVAFMFHHEALETSAQPDEQGAAAAEGAASPDLPAATDIAADTADDAVDDAVEVAPVWTEAAVPVDALETEAEAMAEPMAEDAAEPRAAVEPVPDRIEPEAEADDAAAQAEWEDVYGDGDAGTGFDADDEAVIDEDALREMVARMVRDELQGSVGERITQNVRRMVRREIARALSLQTFE